MARWWFFLFRWVGQYMHLRNAARKWWIIEVWNASNNHWFFQFDREQKIGWEQRRDFTLMGPIIVAPTQVVWALFILFINYSPGSSITWGPFSLFFSWSLYRRRWKINAGFQPWSPVCSAQFHAVETWEGVALDGCHCEMIRMMQHIILDFIPRDFYFRSGSWS